MSDLIPTNLKMSSLDWEYIGLQSMGQSVENVSMLGADLSDDEQAAKYIGKSSWNICCNYYQKSKQRGTEYSQGISRLRKSWATIKRRVIL